jgi:protein required for attachment to host cells
LTAINGRVAPTGDDGLTPRRPAVRKTVTWIVVADHQRARVLMNGGPGRGLQPVAGMHLQSRLKAGRDIVADRPGRSFESRGRMRHAVEPRIDPHRQAAERFVVKVVESLAAASRKGHYDRLVLVAPPRALGEFRKHMPASVKKKLIGEVGEDLTKAPTAALSRHVRDFLAV